jgi:hypothetical protein
MDDRRSANALIDAALDRELEAALAVDPSPEFAARVRARMRNERAWSWPLLAWCVAAVGAVVVTVIVGLPRPDLSPITPGLPAVPDFRPPPQREAAIPEAAVAVKAGPAPERRTPGKTAAKSIRRNASPDEPALLIAAGEARALQQLFADVRQGLADLSSLQQVPATAALQPPSAIAFPPITFEPIAGETAEEGGRQ